MAFQFAPTTNVTSQPLNAPQSAQMGAPVSGNALASLANISNIDTQQQALKKAQATYGADLRTAEANAQKAETEAQKTNLEFGNQKLNTVYTVISPFASDPRVLEAEKLTPESTKEQIDSIRDGLLNVGEESIKELVARGIPKAEAYRLIGPHFMDTEQDPRKAAQNILMTNQRLKMATQKLAGAQNIAGQNQPEVTTVGGVPGFVTKAQERFREIGGNTQPNAQGNVQENAPTGNAGEAQQPLVSEKIVKESFPNRRNTTYLSDVEKPRFETGTKLIQEASQIGDQAQTALNEIRHARK